MLIRAQIKHAIASKKLKMAPGSTKAFYLESSLNHHCHFKATEIHVGHFHIGCLRFKRRQNTRCSQIEVLPECSTR